MADTLLTTKQMDENPSIYSTKTISLIISKNSPLMLRKISGTKMKSGNGREVQFPSLGAIFDSGNASSLSAVQSKVSPALHLLHEKKQKFRLENKWYACLYYS